MVWGTFTWNQFKKIILKGGLPATGQISIINDISGSHTSICSWDTNDLDFEGYDSKRQLDSTGATCTAKTGYQKIADTDTIVVTFGSGHKQRTSTSQNWSDFPKLYTTGTFSSPGVDSLSVGRYIIPSSINATNWLNWLHEMASNPSYYENHPEDWFFPFGSGSPYSRPIYFNDFYHITSPINY